MDDEITPSIIQAQRMNGGVVVEFNNGKSARYTSALLYSIFERAEEFLETEELG